MTNTLVSIPLHPTIRLLLNGWACILSGVTGPPLGSGAGDKWPWGGRACTQGRLTMCSHVHNVHHSWSRSEGLEPRLTGVGTCWQDPKVIAHCL